jgi:hypothetical protein
MPHVYFKLVMQAVLNNAILTFIVKMGLLPIKSQVMAVTVRRALSDIVSTA